MTVVDDGWVRKEVRVVMVAAYVTVVQLFWVTVEGLLMVVVGGGIWQRKREREREREKQ